MAPREETIFALASPPGKGGVAVIRASGPDSSTGLRNISMIRDLSNKVMVYATFSEPVSRETIDKGLAVFFAAPRSFTGEDVVEYHLHGSMAAVRHMLGVLALQPGHRLAMPGEFTRRAFENGKLDLTEAEAVADLINAETSLQKSQALVQLEGGLAALYGQWTDKLKDLLAHMEADLEFPDEDLPEGVFPALIPQIIQLKADIAAHLDDNRRGERLRDGIHVAVIGAPNVGKSSLVNALAQRDVAIVSAHAGTTRDVIEAHLDIGGYPVILADTAGLRPDQLSEDQAQDQIESEGIRRALERAQAADIRLLMFDAAALPALDAHTLALNDERSIVVFNKIDKAEGRIEDNYLGKYVGISVQNGQGLDDLHNALLKRIESLIGVQEAPSLTRQRHREALEEAVRALDRAESAALPELIAEDVRLAIRHLGRITGRVDVEDLLDVIFRDFCIGK